MVGDSMTTAAGSRLIGLVVPEEADVVPGEAARMYPGLPFIAQGIGLQSLSTAGYDEAIERVVPAALSLKRRGATAIMVIGTSLTFYRGAAFNQALIDQLATATALPCSTMSSALVHGLKEIDVRRLAVVTAYSEDVNRLLAAYLAESGYAVRSLRSASVAQRVGEAARTTEDDIFRAGVAAFEAAQDADGILIVCGGLMTLDVTPRLEQHCGVPVVSSMPAALRTAAMIAQAGTQAKNRATTNDKKTSLETTK
jgi:arylmalonate decarboxylase